MVAFAVLALAAGFSAAPPPDGGDVPPLLAIAVCACLVLVDLRRRKELMLLHNLGLTTGVAILIGTGPAVLFETALLAVGR